MRHSKRRRLAKEKRQARKPDLNYALALVRLGKIDEAAIEFYRLTLENFGLLTDRDCKALLAKIKVG